MHFIRYILLFGFFVYGFLCAGGMGINPWMPDRERRKMQIGVGISFAGMAVVALSA